MWLLAGVVAVSCALAEIPEPRCDAYVSARHYAQQVEDALGSLEKSLTELEAQDDPPLKPAHVEAQNLFETHRLVSLKVDSLGPPTLRGSQELRRRLNTAATRLASCRDRIAAIQLRRNNVSASSGDAAAKAASQAWLVGSAPPALAAAVSGAWRDPGEQAISPKAVAVGAKAHPRQGLKYLASSRAFKKERKSVAAIAALHEQGLSETRGDPAARARLVHPQTGETCALVGAQQLLLAYGVLPASGDARAQEDELHAEAVKKGWFRGDRATGGTPFEYVGTILQERGLLVAKRLGASDEELAEVVGNGKIVMASMDPSVLFHNKAFSGATHTVVVTGLERDKRIGEVLGFYVNDSAPQPYFSAGRLVPADVFYKAWQARGSRFVEVR